MKRIKKTLLSAFLILLVAAAAFAAGYYVADMPQAGTVVEGENSGLHLPGEVEKRTVTVDEVEAELVKVGELATYSAEYTVKKSVEQTRYVLDNYAIPGTTNTISLECRGIVKVGYDIDTITPTVDNESRKIYIALPAAAVLDNYVIMDGMEYTEKNSILNPIDFDEYKTLLTEIEAEGLAQAEAEGIYAGAEENVKMVVEHFLAGFDGYTVIFL